MSNPSASPWGESDVAAWRAAASDALVSQEIEWIYGEIARAVQSQRPVCWTSGRCCHFEKTGHRLYVTGLEAAWTVHRLPPAASLSASSLAHAIEAGGCPFQVDRLCAAHAVRPLGCRVYFCDRSAETWQRELYETHMKSLRSLHDRHAIPYMYAEWRLLLEKFLEQPTSR